MILSMVNSRQNETDRTEKFFNIMNGLSRPRLQRKSPSRQKGWTSGSLALKTSRKSSSHSECPGLNFIFVQTRHFRDLILSASRRSSFKMSRDIIYLQHISLKETAIECSH